MAVRKRGSSWLADFMVAGTRYRETFKMQDEAAVWEEDTRTALKRGLPLPKAKSEAEKQKLRAGTIREVLDRASREHWANLPDPQARKNAELFVRWCGPKASLQQALSEENVRKFMHEHLRDERHCSNSTINKYMNSISILIQHSDVTPYKLPRQKDRQGGRKRFFTQAEVRQITQTLKLWGRHDALDFFHVLLDTGARPYVELKAAKWSDIVNGTHISFNESKDGNARTLPLTERSRKIIERIQAQREDLQAGPFSHITQPMMHCLWDRVRAHHPNLKDAPLYTTRHTCASWQAMAGIDMRRIQVWLGHKSIQTTQIYAHLSPDHLVDNLRALEPAADGSERLAQVA